jgi:hypothetical protein
MQANDSTYYVPCGRLTTPDRCCRNSPGTCARSGFAAAWDRFGEPDLCRKRGSGSTRANELPWPDTTSENSFVARMERIRAHPGYLGSGLMATSPFRDFWRFHARSDVFACLRLHAYAGRCGGLV